MVDKVVKVRSLVHRATENGGGGKPLIARVLSLSRVDKKRELCLSRADHVKWEWANTLISADVR